MPLANSLVGIPVGSNIYLGVKMSDGSKRVVSFDGTYPLGTLEVDGDDGFEFACGASPGVHEEQPEVVPFRFLNNVPNAPAGYETLTAELVFTSYNYDPDTALASWTADMYVSGVKQVNTIASGDTDVAVIGETIAVEGDVQIFGDSNCLTYPSGEPATVYARVNTPIEFDEVWGVPYPNFDQISCSGATEADPTYSIRWLVDWFVIKNAPFVAGEVTPLQNNDPYDVDGSPTTFTKP